MWGRQVALLWTVRLAADGPARRLLAWELLTSQDSCQLAPSSLGPSVLSMVPRCQAAVLWRDRLDVSDWALVQCTSGAVSGLRWRPRKLCVCMCAMARYSTPVVGTVEEELCPGGMSLGAPVR